MLVVLLSMTLGQAPTPTPTENLVMKLRNQAAVDVAAAIRKSASGQPFVVTPEPVSNSLLISGTAADVVRLVEQVNKLDAAPMYYMIDIRVCSGDPLGSRAAGTLKVLSEPKIVTTEGTAGFVRAGGQATMDGELVPVGVEMKVAVLSMKDETVRVRIEGANTTLEGSEKERSLKTIRSVTTREVKVAETTRVRVGQKADETWAEITVRPVQPMDPAKIPPYRPQPAK